MNLSKRVLVGSYCNAPPTGGIGWAEGDRCMRLGCHGTDHDCRLVAQTRPDTSLYFEAHVTLDPVFGNTREHAADIAKRHGFKLADLIMRKREGGPSVPHAEDTFMTARSVTWEDIRVRTIRVVEALRDSGFSVRRYKVENTLVDSKAKGGMGGDLWELLR